MKIYIKINLDSKLIFNFIYFKKNRNFYFLSIIKV